MLDSLALTTVLCITTAMVLLLCACLRLVRLPAMHEERPSNADVTVIFLDRAGREVSLARVFTFACALSIALCTGFCTACACVFARDTVLAAAPLHALHPGVLAHLFGDPGLCIGLRGREVSRAGVFYLACILSRALCSAFAPP